MLRGPDADTKAVPPGGGAASSRRERPPSRPGRQVLPRQQRRGRGPWRPSGAGPRQEGGYGALKGVRLSLYFRENGSDDRPSRIN